MFDKPTLRISVTLNNNSRRGGPRVRPLLNKKHPQQY